MVFSTLNPDISEVSENSSAEYLGFCVGGCLEPFGRKGEKEEAGCFQHLDAGSKTTQRPAPDTQKGTAREPGGLAGLLSPRNEKFHPEMRAFQSF